MRLYLYLICLFCFVWIFIYGCENKPCCVPEPAPYAENYMAASIGSSSINGTGSVVKVESPSAGYGNYVLSFTSSSTDASGNPLIQKVSVYMVYTPTFNPLDTGTFLLSSSKNHNMYYAEYAKGPDNAHLITYQSNNFPNNPGSLTISKIDTQKRKLSGYFDFFATAKPGADTYVMNGVFNLISY